MLRRTFLKLLATLTAALALPSPTFADDPTPRMYLPIIGNQGKNVHQIIIDNLRLKYSDMKMIQTYSSKEAMYWDGENVPYFDILNGGFVMDKAAYWSLLPLYDSENAVHVETQHNVITVDGQARLTGLYQGTTNGGFTFAYFSFFEPALVNKLS